MLISKKEVKEMENQATYMKLLQAKDTIETILAESRGLIKGESVVDLSSALVRIASEHQLMQRDICTGLFKTPFDITGLPGKTSENDAHQLWLTYFKDRIRLVTHSDDGSKLKRPSGQDLDLIWGAVRLFSTYNSRKKMFEDIPEWDGVPRIKTFMKDYFNCDCNPNYFLLLLTAIVGKMDDPAKNYVPYFFDIVGDARGTGKSSLLKRIFGEQYVVEAHLTSRTEDFFVTAYDRNALVMMDDEMSWGNAKKLNNFSGDEFKNLVTQAVDSFSRKYCQPETHDRGFVIVRTSNNVQNSFAVVERRQIIFTVMLDENECRINKLGNEYFEQLKAEAKAYYLENGVYQLTEQEMASKEIANLRNYNSDNAKNYAVVKWIEALRDMKPETRKPFLLNIDYDAHHLSHNLEFIGWRGYDDWRKETKNPEVDSRVLKRILEWISKVYPSYIEYNRTEYKLENSSNTVAAARLLMTHNTNKEEQEEIPDLGL